MSETIVDAAQAAENDAAFDPVCLDVPRIYDSCGAKDCLRDLTVFFTQENQELINTATETYYFLCCCEVFTAAGALPSTVMGIAVSTKRVVLYGSDGSAKRFSSNTPAVIDPTEADCCQGFGGSLPVANVQVSAPMALAASLVPVTTPPIVSFVPENVTTFIGGDLVAPDTQQVTVTVGLFSITTLSREVQLMLPSYDFCMPRKECDDRDEDPCEAFSKIEFPSESFFPQSAS